MFPRSLGSSSRSTLLTWCLDSAGHLRDLVRALAVHAAQRSTDESRLVRSPTETCRCCGCHCILVPHRQSAPSTFPACTDRLVSETCGAIISSVWLLSPCLNLSRARHTSAVPFLTGARRCRRCIPRAFVLGPLWTSGSLRCTHRQIVCMKNRASSHHEPSWRFLPRCAPPRPRQAQSMVLS